MPYKMEDCVELALGEYPGRPLNDEEKKRMNAHITEEYKDGIYVGYRYYEKYNVPVQYCFGHGQVLGALIVAALISKNNKKNKFLRAVYFLPVICSATVIGIMWRMILHSNIGFITAALQSMGFGKINFMNTPGLTIFVISFISIWRSFGISAIIYVTAIQQVSPSLYEAAKMDGAGKIQQFVHITVSSIRPTFWYIMMTRFAGALQIFDIIYVTTNGGPNYTTESTVSYIYSRAFSSNSSMGYASAMSVILFIIIMFITVLMYRRMNKED